MNNYQVEPWSPSEELKGLLKNDNISAVELLNAVTECYTFLLGREDFSGPIIRKQLKMEGVSPDSPSKEGILRVIKDLEKTASSFKDRTCIRRSNNHLQQFVNRCNEGLGEHNVEIIQEEDIVIARNLGLDKARKMGFSKIDCNKIATTISELARNIILYTEGGTLKIEALMHNGDSGIYITAEDKGAGIKNLDKVLSGSYKSKDGMGMGLLGSKRLMDVFDVNTGEDGTVIKVIKYLRR